MLKRTWFPTMSDTRIVDRQATSYIHSLWVGLTSPFLNLPTMVWWSIVTPVLFGVWVIFLAFALSILAGITGRVVGFEADEKRK